LCAKFNNFSFGGSRDITAAKQFKMGHATLTTPFKGCFVILGMKLDIAYLCTTFDEPSASRSRDMVNAHQICMVHVT